MIVAAVDTGRHGPSIVLVDDSSEVRTLVRHALSSAGFDVVGECGDGDTAIVTAYRLQPDLILLDSSMPGSDGIEALPALRGVSPTSKIVVFTGFEASGFAHHMRQLGAADFIEKSFPLDQLAERLRSVLKNSEPPGRRLRAVTEPVAGDAPPVAHPADGTTNDDGQAVLNEHLTQFRELFDRAEIGMATLTSNGTIVRANRALATLMRCDPSDLIGVDYGRLTGGKGELLDRGMHNIMDAEADLATLEHELPRVSLDDPPRTARATLAPIRDSRRRVLYVFAQVHDVTTQRAVERDLHESEESFRRLVTAVKEYAIFMIDPAGTVTSWNAGAQRIKGYTAEEIIGKNFRIFYPQAEQDAGHPEHNLEAARRTGAFTEEGWRVRRDGSRFWASVVISPVYDDGGRHLGFAKVTRDLTQQRIDAEERQRVSDEQVHVLAVTAHELRNPTAVIDGSARMLMTEMDRLPADARDELLSAIRAGADRLRRLAMDLSSAAGPQGERPSLVFEKLSLARVLRQAVTRLETRQGNVPVDIDVPEDVTFSADSERLAQALDNLIDNALRHGAAPICLRGLADDMVRIRVIDGGRGIPPDLESHVFQRFATAGVAGGTGLGLPLAREVARQHGGEATYHPPSGREPTYFEISLPWSRSALGPAPAQGGAAAPPGHTR